MEYIERICAVGTEFVSFKNLIFWWPHENSYKWRPKNSEIFRSFSGTKKDYLTSLFLCYLDYHKQLNPRGRAVLKKLTVSQLTKKFPSLHKTQRLLTVFTTAAHWTLSWDMNPVHILTLKFSENQSVILTSTSRFSKPDLPFMVFRLKYSMQYSSLQCFLHDRSADLHRSEFPCANLCRW
jgi:hypothetical protein